MVINITVNLGIIFLFGCSYIKLEEEGQVGMNEDGLKRLVMFVLFRAGINIMDGRG